MNEPQQRRFPFVTSKFRLAILAAVALLGTLAFPAAASGPPGADWKETNRYVISRTKKQIVWLVWYRREARNASSQRFKSLGMTDVLKYLGQLEGQEQVENIVKGFGPLTETELRGLGFICRGYIQKENTTRAFEDVMDLPSRFRNHVFHLAGEISEKATIGKGLANAVDRGLVANNESNQAGLIGQLRAAEQYVKALATTGVKPKSIVVDFESPQIIGKEFREVDISVTVNGRRTDIEVKTNMGKEPSKVRKQIRKDILAHIGDDWTLLFYMYPKIQEGNLDKVRRTFLREFDAIVAEAAARKIPNPFTETRTPTKLRATLEKRLPTLVRTFDLPDLKRTGNEAK